MCRERAFFYKCITEKMYLSFFVGENKMTTPKEVFIFSSELNSEYPVLVIKNSLYFKKKFIDTFNNQIIGSFFNNKKSMNKSSDITGMHLSSSQDLPSFFVFFYQSAQIFLGSCCSYFFAR